MITIYDIAKKSGFSPATVSKALNNYSDIGTKTKKIILNTAKEMEYIGNVMAKGLKTKKMWLVGILLSKNLEIGPHFSGIIESFRKEMETNGYDIIFITKSLGNNCLSYRNHCTYRGVEGVLIESIDADDNEIFELIDSDIPTVTTDNIKTKIPSVNSNNYEGSHMAVEYLLSLGHRKIGILMGPQSSIAGLERFHGFHDAVMEFKLEARREWMIENEKFNFEAGYKGMKNLLEKKELPTAIVASSDLIAFGAIVAATESGYSVPNDISMVGFDDAKFSEYYNPRLTTVRQNRAAMGKTAAHLLTRMINGEKVEMDIRIPVELVIRNSCKKLI